jgi:hypothetical protein
MTSRRHLYALGEPLGDSATRREPGRIVCGGGGDSSSASSTSTTTATITKNTDSRMVVDGGGTGINSGGGNVGNVNVTNISTDSGSIAAAGGVVTDAMAAQRDVSITALNDNAYNTAAVTSATSKLGDQVAQTAALNAQLTAHIADAALGTASGISSSAFSAATAQSKQNSSDLKTLVSAGLNLFDTNATLTKNLAQGAASAYSDATAQANGNKQLLIVGLAVVGVVAAFAVMGKH